MRAHLFVFVLLSLLGVSLAELRHAYENIAFFLGYRAELLLKPEDERIIGVKCAGADPSTLKCRELNPKYTHCKGSVVVKKAYGDEKITDACNLREFLSHISGGKQQLKTDPLSGEAKNYREQYVLGDEDALYADVDYAAKQMGTSKAGFKPGENWCKIKDGEGNYETTATRFGQRLVDMKNGRTPEQVKKTEILFQRIDEALVGLVTDRECDISRHLIPELEKKKITPLAIEVVSGNRKNFNEADTIHAIESTWAGKPDGENIAKKLVAEMKAVIKAYFATGDAANHLRIKDRWAVFTGQPVVQGCSPRMDSV
ncbi:hypothetical protein PWT90_03840 [Aphanocladium album]|nr:hypothetical protein PWT90_03840 [Aphanocladium album]